MSIRLWWLKKPHVSNDLGNCDKFDSKKYKEARTKDLEVLNVLIV